MSASEQLAQERRRVESMALRVPVVSSDLFVAYDFSWDPDPAVGVWSAFLPSPPRIFVINIGSMGISLLFPLSFLPVSTFAERWLAIAKDIWRRCLNAHLDEGKRYHRRSCIVVCSAFFRGSPAPQKSQEWGCGGHQCDRKSNGRA